MNRNQGREMHDREMLTTFIWLGGAIILTAVPTDTQVSFCILYANLSAVYHFLMMTGIESVDHPTFRIMSILGTDTPYEYQDITT